MPNAKTSHAGLAMARDFQSSLKEDPALYSHLMSDTPEGGPMEECGTNGAIGVVL